MANTLTLSVDTGAVNIELKDMDGEKIGEFKFNPTDSSILSRYEAVVEFFDKVDFPQEMSREQELEKVKELDKAICEQFDYLLGYKVSGGIFATCGPLTTINNGDFYFETVLDGIGKLIEDVAGKRIENKLKKVRAAIEESKK